MKTVIIWDQCGYENIHFAVVDRDVTHLADVYINNMDDDPSAVDELTNMFYDETGRCIMPLEKDFPVQAVKDGAAVICCGFLP